jgi:hypothetical protein
MPKQMAKQQQSTFKSKEQQKLGKCASIEKELAK